MRSVNHGLASVRCGFFGLEERSTAFLGFVEAAVTDEGGEGGGVRDVETGVAVEETALDDVSAEKTPAGAKDRGDGGKFRATGLVLLEEEVGEGIYFGDVRGERGERVVMQIAAEARDGAGAVNLFVYELVAAPAGAGAIKETEAEVGIPVAVGDPAVDEPDLAGDQ